MDSAAQRSRIILPRHLRRPIRVRVSDKHSTRVHEYLAHTPFRVGYGKDCDLHLDGGDGPETLFEFSPVTGPTKLSTPVRLEDVNDRVELLIDGQPYKGDVRELKPGAQVVIRDRVSNRRFDLLVDQPPSWSRHLRTWLFVGLALLGALSLYGVYVYQTLGDTEQRLTQAEIRLQSAEAGAQKTDAKIMQILADFQSREVAVEKTLQEISAIQRQSQSALRDEFAMRLKQITNDSKLSLSRTAQEDSQAREQLAADTAQKVATLRLEISDKLIAAFERFKQLEQQVLVGHAQRLQTLEIRGDQFKRILSDAAGMVMFVHTRYTAQLVTTGETREVDSAGTAFLVGENGIAVAPQHVFEPWRYDTEFLALRELGVIEVVPDSLVHFVWMAGEQVIEPNSRPTKYLTEYSFTESSEGSGLVVLHRPEPASSKRLVPSPLGLVSVEGPIPGPTDIVVFQLLDFTRRYPLLNLERRANVLSPLDEVLVVGYPMARLKDGRSSAQGVKGFVRRIGKDLLELDTALHPGSSGAPVLNESGNVVGMAIAMIGSDSYGAAIPSGQVQQAVSAAGERIRNNKARLLSAGCIAGPVDDTLDQRTWLAMRKPGCEFR